MLASRAHVNVSHSFLFSPCYSLLLDSIHTIIKCPLCCLWWCDVWMYCAKNIQKMYKSKKVPRESKNAGSIYNVSNSVKKYNKNKIVSWIIFPFKFFSLSLNFLFSIIITIDAGWKRNACRHKNSVSYILWKLFPACDMYLVYGNWEI